MKRQIRWAPDPDSLSQSCLKSVTSWHPSSNKSSTNHKVFNPLLLQMLNNHPGPKETLYHRIKLLQVRRPDTCGYEVLQKNGVIPPERHHRSLAGPPVCLPGIQHGTTSCDTSTSEGLNDHVCGLQLSIQHAHLRSPPLHHPLIVSLHQSADHKLTDRKQ